MSLGIYNGANSNISNGMRTGVDIGTATGMQTNNDYDLKLVPSSLMINYDASNRVSHVGNSSATTWNNLSGRDLAGAITSNVTYSSTYKGGLSFPGATPNAVVVDASASGSLSFLSDFTLQFTFVATSMVGSRALHTGWLQGGPEVRINANGSIQLVRALVADIGTSAAGLVLINTPYTLIVTKTLIGANYTFNIYLNGTLRTTLTTATNFATSYPQLGRNGNGINNAIVEMWIGTIHSYQYYSRALTNSEVYQNHLALRTRFIPNYLL